MRRTLMESLKRADISSLKHLRRLGVSPQLLYAEEQNSNQIMRGYSGNPIVQHGEQRWSMPAEWQSQQRTLMSFPTLESVGTYSKKDLSGCRREVVAIANAIAKYQPVWLYAQPSDAVLASSMVDLNVTIQSALVENLWIRDTGPVFVKDESGATSGVDFNFNFWGKKVPTKHQHDRALARYILEEANVPCLKSNLTLEGGGIEVDGEGTFMATESSIINKNRNPGMDKTAIEAEISLLLGIEKFIWFRGIEYFAGDVTDCHVDALARFAPGNCVILSKPNRLVSRKDAGYKVYAQARSVLESATNVAGQSLRIVEIESPPLKQTESGDDCEMNYANYLVINDAVVVPRFGNATTDASAVEILKACFPQREIVQVDLHYLSREGGGIHCATQQWPNGSLGSNPLR